MLLYNNSECPCEKLLWRNKNASCSENLRLDCLHFIEKMNLIFNSSTCYLTDFRFSDKKSNIFIWSALHATFNGEVPSLESFLTQDAVGNEGPAVPSSP